MRKEVINTERAGVEYTYPEEGNIECYISRIIPHEGYKVYQVPATYAKQRKYTNYYLIAKNTRDARQRFKNIYALDIIGKITEVTGDLKEELLTSEHCYPLY